MGPGSVGGKHSADRALYAAGRVRSETPAQACQPVVETPVDYPWLHTNSLFADLDNGPKMATQVDDEATAERFTGDPGAGSPRYQGDLVLCGIANNALDVAFIARDNDPQGLHLENAGVGAVQSAGKFVEEQLAF